MLPAGVHQSRKSTLMTGGGLKPGGRNAYQLLWRRGPPSAVTVRKRRSARPGQHPADIRARAKLLVLFSHKPDGDLATARFLPSK